MSELAFPKAAEDFLITSEYTYAQPSYFCVYCANVCLLQQENVETGRGYIQIRMNQLISIGCGL